MKRVVWIAVIVAASAAAFVIWRSRDDVVSAAGPSGGPHAALDARSPTTTAPTTPAPTPERVSADHERRETESVITHARALVLNDSETSAILASLSQLQSGRRELFADLAAKQITTEQVSRGLHELRARMYVRFEEVIGPERAHQLQLRIQADHR